MAKDKSKSKQAIKEKVWQTFSHELEELLEKFESQLLSIENDLKNTELIAGLFRVVHTFKGTCGMMGLVKIQELTHVAEDVMDQVRAGKLIITTDILDQLFQVLDFLKQNTERLLEDKSDENILVEPSLLAGLEALLVGPDLGSSNKKNSVVFVQTQDNNVNNRLNTSKQQTCALIPIASENNSGDEKFWEQIVYDCLELLGHAENVCLQLEFEQEQSSYVDTLFRDLHTLKGNFNLSGLNCYAQLFHLYEDLFGLVRDRKAKIKSYMTDTLLSGIDLVSSKLGQSKQKNQDLTESEISQLKEKIIGLIRSIEPNYNFAQQSPEPTFEMSSQGVTIDQTYLDLFWEVVWDNLKIYSDTLDEVKETELTLVQVNRCQDCLTDISATAERISLAVVSEETKKYLDRLRVTPLLLDDARVTLHQLTAYVKKVQGESATLLERTGSERDVSAEAEATTQKNCAQFVETLVFADDLFETLWGLLKILKKSAEADDEQTQWVKQLRGHVTAIGKLVLPISELHAEDILCELKRVLEIQDQCELKDQLSAVMSATYQYFWDLEDQLQGSELTKTDKVEVPPKAESHSKSVEPHVTPFSVSDSLSDPVAVEQHDPNFIVDFLQKAQEDMEIYQSHKLAWMKASDPDTIQSLTEHLKQLLQSSLRLNHTQLAQTIANFIECRANKEWMFDAKVSEVFELRVFELLWQFENLLPKEMLHNQEHYLNAGHVFKQWHAQRCFGVLKNVLTSLDWLELHIANFMNSLMNKRTFEHLNQLQAEMQSLVFAAQFYGLKTGEKGFLYLKDFFARIAYDPHLLSVDLLQKISTFIKGVSATVREIKENGHCCEETLATCYQHILSCLEVEVETLPVESAKNVFAKAQLPECISANLNTDIFVQVSKHLDTGQHLYTLYMDVEADEEMANHAFELLESNALFPVFSVTDYVDNRSVFYFLVFVEPGASALIKALSQIDPSGTSLKADLIYPPPRSMEGDVGRAKTLFSNTKLDASEELCTNIAMLKQTMGEMICIKSNFSQIVKDMANLELSEFVDQEIYRHNGVWSAAKSEIKIYLQSIEDKFKGLFQAQQEIDTLFNKLQSEFSPLHEINLFMMLDEMKAWHQTAFAGARAPIFDYKPTNLALERPRAATLDWALKQLLYVFASVSAQADEHESRRIAVAFDEADGAILLRLNTDSDAISCEALGIDCQDRTETEALSGWLNDADAAAAIHVGVGRVSVSLQEMRTALTAQGISLTHRVKAGVWVESRFGFEVQNRVMESIVAVIKDTQYVFSIQTIQRIIQFDEGACISACADGPERMLEVGGQVIPLMVLHDSSTKQNRERQVVLILNYADQCKGVLVDRLIGLQQVLVAPLTGELRNSDYVKGFAVLGRDSIGMVVDTPALFSTHYSVPQSKIA